MPTGNAKGSTPGLPIHVNRRPAMKLVASSGEADDSTSEESSEENWFEGLDRLGGLVEGLCANLRMSRQIRPLVGRGRVLAIGLVSTVTPRCKRERCSTPKHGFLRVLQ